MLSDLKLKTCSEGIEVGENLAGLLPLFLLDEQTIAAYDAFEEDDDEM